MPRPTPPVTTRAALRLVTWSLLACLASPAVAAEWPRSGPRPSPAGAWLLQDEVARGAKAPEWLARFGLERVSAEEASIESAAPPDAAGYAPSPRLDGLAVDRQVNNKAPDALCSGCSFRPLSQAETTVAMQYPNLLVGWNNTRGFCAGTAVQGYGWSIDGGQTWTDAGDPTPLAGGGRYRGDPVHAVNRQTGRFYLAGLYEGGALGSGVAVLDGHFNGAAFVVDGNRQVAVGGADFIDKEWMDVDSLSGNVYLSWTTFQSGGGNQIEFARFDADLASLGPRQVISGPAANGNVQGSRVVVGPDGVVWIVWYEYGVPLSSMKIRKSTDFGASFGPEAVVATFYENGYNGAPGYRRGFAPTFPSVAVDAGTGPRRGRLYVTWDETINFYDAVFPSLTARVSVEKDDFFSRATAFPIGAVLRGSAGGSTDIDLYSFAATAGQTLVLRTDSLAAGVSLGVRIVCAADTGGTGTYRYLAFNSGPAPALCWTAPVTANYYLRIVPNTSTTGAYVLNTTTDAAGAGDRARANRDHFVTHSDDGVSWSTPVRLNDNPPLTDGIFAEVAVDELGRVHAFWHDFRDDLVCGAESFEYGASSGDGGVTWGANRPVSDATSFWSFEACGSANHGDYQGITADGARVAAAWSDSRLGDPDVWTDVARHQHAAGCGGSTATVAAGGDTTLAWTVDNPGSVDEPLAWQVTDTAGWVTGVLPSAAASSLVPAGGSLPLSVSIHVPGDCASSPDTVSLEVENLAIPGETVLCTLVVTCAGNVDVRPAAGSPALRFDLPHPNPSRGETALDFSLPAAGRARLVLYSLSGARVRTLCDDERPAGPARLRWDGRDQAGRLVPPGTYFARLEAAGRRLTRTVILSR